MTAEMAAAGTKSLPEDRKDRTEAVCTVTVKLCGLDRSSVETAIRDLTDLQSNPAVSLYDRAGEVHLRLRAGAATKKEAKKLLAPLRRELRKRFGKAIYTERAEETLEMAVVRLLKRKGLTLTTVESCTGGAIAARIVNVPGASEVLTQGLITYSNEAKHRLVGVKNSTLKKHGAVSPQTAKAMAKGGCRTSGCDMAIATTGIAGPGGGTKKKPVGLVYLGCSCCGTTEVKELRLGGDREQIREQSVTLALALVRQMALSCKEK